MFLRFATAFSPCILRHVTFRQALSTSLSSHPLLHSSLRSSSVATRNQYSEERNYRRFDASAWRRLLFGGLCAAGLLASFKELVGLGPPLKLDEDPLKDNIKRAILAMQFGKLDEAEEILHVALEQARTAANEDGVNYVYDLLANLYYAQGDNDKAETTFLELMKRVLSTGKIDKSHPAMIEISLKLSNIYTELGDTSKAETGYLFCLEHQAKNVGGAAALEEIFARPDTTGPLPEPTEQDDHDNVHNISLYGICADSYGHFLILHNRLKEAAKFMREAYLVAKALHGPKHRLTVILLNNYGSVCLRNGDNEFALKALGETAALVKKFEDMDDLRSGFLLNYAEALYHSSKLEDAISVTKEAIAIARGQKDQIALDNAKSLLNELVKERSLVKA